MKALRHLLVSLGIPAGGRPPAFGGEARPAPSGGGSRRVFALQALCFVACLGGMAALGWMGVRHLVLGHQMFSFRSFVFETDGHIGKAQALRWSGVRQHANILTFDLARIQRSLERVPLIEEVKVERVIPDRLVLQLKERKPVFRLEYLAPEPPDRIGLRPYLVDGSGFVYSPFLSRRELEGRGFWKELPELVGFSSLPVYPGEASSSRRLLGAIDLWKSFQESPLSERFRIRSIDLSRKRSLIVRTSDGQEVVLGLGSHSEGFRRWERIRQRLLQEGMDLVRLDLSTGNNNPVIWRPRAVPEPPMQLASPVFQDSRS